MTKRTRIAFYLFFAFVISAIAHNAVSALFNIEEAFFFIIAIISFFAFALYFVYGTIFRFRKGTPSDWWKISYLGYLGFLGFIPSFGSGLFGFYGFFGLISLKKN